MQDVNTRPFLSALGMILLFCFSAFSVAQAQEKSNKKIIIKHKIVTEDGNVTVTEKVIEGEEDEIVIVDGVRNINPRIRIGTGDLGVENEVIIIEDGIREVLVPGSQFRVKGTNPFFVQPDPSHDKLTVLTLHEGEEIPEAVQQQIIDMGLDIEMVKAQLESAERMIRIVQYDEEPATLEVDGPESSFEGFKELNFFDSKNPGFDFDFNFNEDLEIDENIRLFDKDFEIEVEDGFFFKQDGEDNINLFFNKDGEDQIFKVLPEGDNNNVFWFENTCENKAQLGVYIEKTEEDGVTITNIIPESAADVAGLQAGDRITQINGKTVSEIGGLTEEIQNLKVGDEVNITFVRDGNTQTVATALQARREAMNPVPNWRFRGDNNWSWSDQNWDYKVQGDCESLCKAPFIGVYITDSWSEKTQNGVVITGIFEGTEAERLGLQEKDLILSIDGQAVTRTQEIIEIIRGHEPGDQIQLTYQHEGNTQTVQATVGRKADAKKYNHCDCDNPETLEREQPSKTEIIILKQPVEASIDLEVEEDEPGPTVFE
ncbi:MAG: PDZ domain-containing protein, partial [Bacteroidota bacterium]